MERSEEGVFFRNKRGSAIEVHPDFSEARTSPHGIFAEFKLGQTYGYD